MPMPAWQTRKDGIPIVEAPSATAWRSWLDANHATVNSIWLVMHHKHSSTPSVRYDEAVDEALCYGWVDSKPNKRNDESYFQRFSKRNPKSNWSKVNKEKVARLSKAGKMAEPGLQMVNLAKASGTWTALDEVEAGVVPPDLQAAFNANATAFSYWEKFPRSTKRAILEWIFNAKRQETRAMRVDTTVAMAAENLRANQHRQLKKR